MARLVPFLLLALSTPALAEDTEAETQQTLFSERVAIGGFGGPVLKFTPLAKELGVLVGGRGGVIIGHSLWLGGGGNGLANEIELARAPGAARRRIGFGYGGPMIGWRIFSSELVHAEVTALVGGGGLSFRIPHGVDEDGEPEYESDSDGFLVIEPEVSAELNLLAFMRLAVGVSWRFLDGVETGSWRDADFSGPAGQLTLSFGHF